MIVQGPRALLRGFHPEEFDAAWAGRLRSTTTIGRVGPGARERFLRRLEHSGDWHEGRLDLAIELHGALVGEVDVRSNMGVMPPGVCELGIELWAEHRGRGLGTEVVGVLTQWLHEQGYPRVQAGTNVANRPMRRVLEKLGFEHEGDLRSFAPESDGRADYALYAHVAG